MMKDPILNTAEQRIEAQLQPVTRQNYNKIVTAGLAFALHGGPNSIAASLQNSKSPIYDCASGAINLVLLLRKQAHGVMPPQALVPAALVLMMHGLDVAENLGKIEITDDVLAEATHVFTQLILPRLGLPPQKVAQMTQKVHGIINDPNQMERVNRAAGVVQDPRASTPTPGV